MELDIRRKRQLEVANYLMNKYTKDILMISHINDFIREVYDEMTRGDFRNGMSTMITDNEVDEIKSFISGI